MAVSLPSVSGNRAVGYLPWSARPCHISDSSWMLGGAIGSLLDDKFSAVTLSSSSDSALKKGMYSLLTEAFG
ncbi:uncharacterized protein LOC123321955 isoform X2 [Coccinella septempunctata]|uniref:uncharacterized protein LOC123311912 isoform X2 n=1 Tax=Coccinella septempunctata TaxID=41139 RepID=UPI001D07B7F0|nr:uncharacterized protein LOC123311912 isoform X2 [Coccinella septempunctata]XP_044759834.1 uncharacterized protein LOC123317388 isoform X2 [Coccinella septempunctata]XP_044765679.1 uncharacterized protein LOC123321934 isoform X2 [Coccinella septempunctata]XP_044765707.1 uncharacterized protein LOC123321955 isoform X2 [Coccinella septempunctata]